jgi:glycerophosphoryl diester phosphodiesterase
MNFFTHQPRVVGHRGHLYNSLENTRHSLKLAAKYCSEVECDVFLLKCGTLCVFHGGGGDKNPGLLKNHCNMDASILDLTYDEARALQFNPNYKDFGCGPEVIEELQKQDECYIPTLKEVLLDAQDTGVIVKIELKGPGTEEPVLQLVEELDMVDQVHFSSFYHSRIKRIRELRPDKNRDGSYRYKTGALFNECPDNFIEMALDAGASEVHLKYSTCTKERVKMIHAAGMDSMIWMRGPVGMKRDMEQLFDEVEIGNEDESMYLAIMKTGVKAMCVNRPDVLQRLLKKQKLKATN